MYSTDLVYTTRPQYLLQDHLINLILSAPIQTCSNWLGLFGFWVFGCQRSPFDGWGCPLAPS